MSVVVTAKKVAKTESWLKKSEKASKTTKETKEKK